jgi:integrase
MVKNHPNRELCMRGAIHSDQKCLLCGARYQQDERRRGLFCPDHPDQRANGRFRVYFGRQTCKRFSTYEEAERFLDGLRWEVDQKTYDPRDYRANAPLGFTTLAEKWIETRSKQVEQGALKSATLTLYQNYMDKARAYFGQKNVKAISTGDIEDFLNSLDLSGKSVSNHKSALNTFFQWIQRREKIEPPEMPETPYTLGTRNIINWKTQQAVMERAKIDTEFNPKVCFGLELLATYPELRPGDLAKITESDIDTEFGLIRIDAPTKNRGKGNFLTIRLIPEHAEEIRRLKAKYPGAGKIQFFRHTTARQGCRIDQPFGESYLYRNWKRAAAKLGITDVDLYGGTRHSTTTEIGKHFGEARARAATGHRTNKAFERYYQYTGEAYKITAAAARIRKAEIIDIASARDGKQSAPGQTKGKPKKGKQNP